MRAIYKTQAGLHGEAGVGNHASHMFGAQSRGKDSPHYQFLPPQRHLETKLPHQHKGEGWRRKKAVLSFIQLYVLPP